MTEEDLSIKLDSPRCELAAGALNIPWSELRRSTLIKLIEGKKNPNKDKWDRIDKWLMATQKEPAPDNFIAQYYGK